MLYFSFQTTPTNTVRDLVFNELKTFKDASSGIDSLTGRFTNKLIIFFGYVRVYKKHGYFRKLSYDYGSYLRNTLTLFSLLITNQTV